MFQHLLACMDGHDEVGMPESAPGGTSVTQIALSKDYDDILHLAITTPRLFPR